MEVCGCGWVGGCGCEGVVSVRAGICVRRGSSCSMVAAATTETMLVTLISKSSQYRDANAVLSPACGERVRGKKGVNVYEGVR